MIHRLPSDVIDQIAAGEVVERPAHLVKELIENSIDAGADQIDVEVGQGGQFVRVKDNGLGLAPEELSLALARHATSKISSAADLWKLSSFGFRGEALASLSAVSRLTLSSRKKGALIAHRVISEFGKISEVVEVGGAQGTTVQVEDLFANVPARLKFLRSAGAEVNQVKNLFRAIGLSHPKVQLRLKHEGQLVFFWPLVADLQKRARQVLGQETLYFAQGKVGSAQVRVVFGSPKNTVGSAKNIYLFIQNRWVQDRGLQAAVMQAYRNLLMHREYPVAVVWFELNPEEVDVNIHPSKSQVKFQDASAAFRLVQSVLREALEKAPWVKSLLQDSKVERPAKVGDPVETLQETNTCFSGGAFDQTLYPLKSTPTFGVRETLKTYAAERVSEQVGVEEETLGTWGGLQVLGQADLTYIVAQSRTALLLVDQHAAHERVVFEKLMNSWKKGEQMEVQELLLPLNLDLDLESVEALVGASQELERLGIRIDHVGPETVAIRSHPIEIKEKGLVLALERLAREKVQKGGSFALEQVVGDFFASMACHSVVRAGQALSRQEMESLLQQMDQFPLSSFCPHGRPVYVEYSFCELEKNFGRIV